MVSPPAILQASQYDVLITMQGSLTLKLRHVRSFLPVTRLHSRLFQQVYLKNLFDGHC